MKKEDLRNLLLSHITECEWRGLERGDDTLRIGEFNLDVLLRMRKRETLVCGNITEAYRRMGAGKPHLRDALGQEPLQGAHLGRCRGGNR